MKIARFWRRSKIHTNGPDGRPIEVAAWGWSADDPAEAQRQAEERSQRSAKRIAAGKPFPNTYESYGDRPAREEILREIKSEDGETIAMLTRNRYGAVVLNTADLMFIDIDVPEPPPSGIIDAIKSLFGNKPQNAFVTEQERIAAIASERPDYTIRLYRTFAGFRCAVVNKRIKPGTPESDALLSAFGSDPLYVRLCRNQESFRARLTPKFWRCGYESPRGRFPFRDEAEKEMYRNWERGYEQASGSYSTCVFVEQFGNDRTVADFRGLIELHDRDTRTESNLPLA
jgi:hypothetical protein